MREEEEASCLVVVFGLGVRAKEGETRTEGGEGRRGRRARERLVVERSPNSLMHHLDTKNT